MNHADVKGHLPEYLEGELALETRAVVDAHLDGCPACAAEVDELMQTIRLLRILPEPEVPPMITANVMRRIRAGETRPSGFQRLGRILGTVLEPSFVMPASAIAAAALVVMVAQNDDLRPSFGTGLSAQGGSPTNSEASVIQTPSSTRRFELEPIPLSAGLEATRRELERAAGQRPFGAPDAQDLVADASATEARSAASGQAAPGLQIRIQVRQPSSAHPGVFSDPILYPGQPAARVASSPLRTRRNSGGGTITQVAGPALRLPAVPAPATGSAGSDPRDTWLARGLGDPAGFAAYLSQQNLAEQELWVSRLSRRAESRGLLDELVDALRNSGDPIAAVIGDDFSAAASRLRSDGEVSSGTPSR